MRLDAEALALNVVSIKAEKTEARSLTLWKGQTNAFFVILTFSMPEPVMAKYSVSLLALFMEIFEEDILTIGTCNCINHFE